MQLALKIALSLIVGFCLGSIGYFLVNNVLVSNDPTILSSFIAIIGALIGALIGGGIAYLTTNLQSGAEDVRTDKRLEAEGERLKLQLSSEEASMKEQRFFESKRNSYAEGLAVLARATVAVARKQNYPDEYGDAEVLWYHNRLGSLTLHASEAIQRMVSEFHDEYPDETAIKVGLNSKTKFAELIKKMNEIRKEMRKELGF